MIANGVRRIHYKFHPAQMFTGENEGLEAVVIEAARGIEVRRLPGPVILENLTCAAPHIRFYVNVSSVGIYAAQFGCKVYSYAPYCAEVEPAFQRKINELPDSFAQAVEFLEV